MSPDEVWPFDLQSTILILQLLITTAGLVITLWIAKKYGEEAATKFVLREERRHDHATLCTGQIQTIQACLQEPRMAMRSSDFSGLAPRSVNLDSFAYETSFMIQHLKTGYRDTWKRMDEYVKAFNSLWTESFQELKPIADSISVAAKKQGATSNGTDLLCNAMAGIFEQAFQPNSQVQHALIDLPNHRVMVGGYVAAWGPDSTDFGEIAQQIDREVSLHLNPLMNIWMRAQNLNSAREQLVDALHRIEIDVQHGIILAGWCESGIKAGLEDKSA